MFDDASWTLVLVTALPSSLFLIIFFFFFLSIQLYIRLLS